MGAAAASSALLALSVATAEEPVSATASPTVMNESSFMTLRDDEGKEVSFTMEERNGDVRIVGTSGQDLGLKVVAHPNGAAPTLERRGSHDPVLDNSERAGDVPTVTTYNTNGVDVPPEYDYDPGKGSLHDFCALSPDQLGGADFRGACALHDMCYDGVNQGIGTHHDCNIAFLNNLRTVCDGQGIGRSSCNAAAEVYFRAVEAKNP